MICLILTVILTSKFGLQIMHKLIQISQPTIWRILKWTIKWKPFKFLTVQGLEQSHIDQRKQFCEWLLQQSQEFPQKVLWSDEKWWVLHQKPNKQNDRYWAPVNPHRYIESNYQGDVKASINPLILYSLQFYCNSIRFPIGKDRLKNGCVIPASWPPLAWGRVSHNLWTIL